MAQFSQHLGFDLANAFASNREGLAYFFGSGLAPELLHQLLTGTSLLVNRLDHVHRNADGARLVRDGPGDRLANPPRRIRRKFVAAAPLKLVGALHEANVAFLD